MAQARLQIQIPEYLTKRKIVLPMETLKTGNIGITQLLQKQLTNKILFYGFPVHPSLNSWKNKMREPKKGKVMRQKEYKQRAPAKYSFEGQPERG